MDKNQEKLLERNQPIISIRQKQIAFNSYFSKLTGLKNEVVCIISMNTDVTKLSFEFRKKLQKMLMIHTLLLFVQMEGARKGQPITI